MEDKSGVTVEEKEKGNEEPHEDHKKKKKKEQIIEELQKTLLQKEEALKISEEKLLYFQAEFENFKKLKNKEKQELLKYGNEALLQELVPVLDNLDMALSHAAKTEDSKGIAEGVQMTVNQFLKVLEKAGVMQVAATGQKFDPNLHEAMYQEERDDLEPDMVVSEFQKGYLLNGRLLRPARVIVSKKPDLQ